MYQWLNHHFSRMVHGGWEALAPQIIDDDEDQAFLIGPQSTHIEIPMPALGLLFGQAVQLIGSLLELDEIVTKAHEALVNMKVYVKALNVSTA